MYMPLLNWGYPTHPAARRRMQKEFQSKNLSERTQEQTLVFKPTLWSALSITMWNDFRYPKTTVYINNSIRFIDDLRMLENLMLCRRVVITAGKNIILLVQIGTRRLGTALVSGLINYVRYRLAIPWRTALSPSPIKAKNNSEVMEKMRSCGKI